jgi:hypothetical protein
MNAGASLMLLHPRSRWTSARVNAPPRLQHVAHCTMEPPSAQVMLIARPQQVCDATAAPASPATSMYAIHASNSREFTWTNLLSSSD